jgi:hypothetical protein
MSRILALTVLAALALAGCITPQTPVDPLAAGEGAGAFAPLVPAVPDFDFSTVVDPDHANHQLPALHTGGHGLSLVGHAAIQSILPPTVSGSITQIDVWENYAVVSGMEGGMAFAIVDITDPAAPQAVSWWPSTANGWTARFSSDGQYVFYGCQMLGAPYASLALVKGTCEDAESVHVPGNPPAGIVAIDVSDKASPKFVSFLAAGGSHNIFVETISGVDTIFTASTAIIQLDRETGEMVQVAEVPGVHDATVAKHPVTGDWLLFTGTGELSIYNVNDPTAPELVFEGQGDEGWVAWHEQTLVPGLVDGRVILVGGGESFVSTGGVPDIVSFLDVTDPANPTLLSQWKPPFESAIPWASYLYSVHEIAATPTGQVAISWYHAGVWVVDVSTQERQAEPAVLAAYLPANVLNVTPATFEQTAVPYVPFVWGAGWDARGYLVVPDMHTGVYVLEPEWGLHPALDSGQ